MKPRKQARHGIAWQTENTGTAHSIIIHHGICVTATGIMLHIWQLAEK